MRIALSAFATLALAIPSVCFGQIVIPYPGSFYRVDRPDHPIPIATVTPAGDVIGLDGAHQYGTFVIGAATLDLKDPNHPMIAFTLMNPTALPILLSSVYVDDVRANLRDTGDLVLMCRSVPRLSHAGPADKTLQPGTWINVEMPIPPACGWNVGETAGFLVYLKSGAGVITPETRTEEVVLLHSAFEKLRSQSQH